MSQYIVSARKYRPTRFGEVVGQWHVAETLNNALQNNKLAHAYLFCGPRGVGKTSCARILAQTINCENEDINLKPCNNCSSCISYKQNSAFNTFELDAASNNSVESIRSLIEQVRIPPQQGKYKVFIIDEVHMLSTSAFNAFLKTLEEPPSFAIFILATTEKHKILPTILSRCQVFDFKRITIEDITSHLQFICKQENIKAEEQALHLIAQKGDGSLRDALSIFDRISSATNNNITYQSILEELNLLDYEYFFKFIDNFLIEDLSSNFLLLDEIIEKGYYLDIVLSGLSQHMRELLICKDERTHTLLSVSSNFKAKYIDQSQYIPKALLLSGLEILNECEIVLEKSANKRLTVELAISKINYAHKAIKRGLFSNPNIENVTTVEHKKKQTLKEIEEKTIEKVNDNQSTSSKNNDISSKQKSNNVLPNESSLKEEKNSVDKVSEIKTPPKIVSGNYSLDSILASVDEEESIQNKAQENFTTEKINILWKDYHSQIEAPSIKNALVNSKFTIDVLNKKIIVDVPSEVNKEYLMNETELIDRIRITTGIPTISIEIIVNPSLFPDYRPPKREINLTTKEKYIKFSNQKPSLKTLVNTLGLKPD